MKEKSKHYWIYSFPIGLVVHILFDMDLWSCIGLTFSFFPIYQFIKRSGEYLPLRELMVVIATIQWIIGPFVDYHTEVTHYKFHMYVSENFYMSFAVLSVMALWVGLTYFIDDIHIDELQNRTINLVNKHPDLPYWLIIAGFIASFSYFALPTSLQFVAYIVTNFKYIGVTYLLLSKNKNRWAVFGAIMFLDFSFAIATSMFHDFLLWNILLFTYLAHELKFSFKNKAIIFVFAIVFTVTLQGVKPRYRLMQTTAEMSQFELFVTLIIDEWKTGEILKPGNDNEVNVRFNQGWIISSILKNVPNNEAYANGSTIIDACVAAIVPRILWQEKKIAGGRENFMRFTGLKLSEGTSMGISLAGEGWANFGFWGGIIFILSWGLFISLFWVILVNFSKNYPTILLWTPIIFLQVVKAETELVVVLNHLVKSSILIIIILKVIKNQFNVRL